MPPLGTAMTSKSPSRSARPPSADGIGDGVAVLIVVLATEHPDEDPWVVEQAGIESDRSGLSLPPYQGKATMPDGQEVHLYGDAEVADRAMTDWAEQRLMQDRMQ